MLDNKTKWKHIGKGTLGRVRKKAKRITFCTSKIEPWTKKRDLFWRSCNLLIFILFIQYAPFWGKDYVRPFPNTLIGTESKGKMTKYWHFFCFCNALLHENLFFLAENRWSCDGVFSLSIQMRHGYEYISVDFQPRKYQICFFKQKSTNVGEAGWKERW